jgi:plastocyanin
MKTIISFVLISALLLLAACNQTVEQSSAVDAPMEAMVELKNSAFVPNTVTIKRGGTVTFVNKDSVTHTATGDDFDSGDLENGDSYDQTFTKTGNKDVKCNYHPNMKLRVIVK